MVKGISLLRRRTTKYGGYTAIMVLLMLGILVAIYAFAMNHNWRFDLTENLRYSLSPQSQKILRSLEEPVKAYAFFKEAEPSREAARALLDRYQYYSKQFSWEFLDPDRFPLKAQSYNVTTYDIIVLARGDRFEKATLAEEENITNALLKLTREEKRVIYFLEGHGEHGLEHFEKDGYSEIRKALENENYEVKPLMLAGEEGVPEDADLVLVGGPIKAYLDEELASLRAYLEIGGKVLILTDPEKSPGMEAFLETYGIELGNDIIVDRGSRVLVGDYLVPLIAQYEYHPITKDFRQRPVLTFLPLAQSVRPAEEPPEGIQVKELARTGPGSWGERDLERLKDGEAQLDPENDFEGPVPVAVVASIRTGGEEEKATMVVFGDSDFIANGYIDPERSGNQDLFLNTVNWLAEQEDLISIRPKSAASRPIRLQPSEQILIFVLAVVAFPLSTLLAGLGILWRKRWRK
jgi:ABC-type uncharacterized transport system involved in gliding motility auxiliary subunit